MMNDDLTTAEAELRSLRVIMRRAESLSPASRRWLIARLEALGESENGEAAGIPPLKQAADE